MENHPIPGSFAIICWRVKDTGRLWNQRLTTSIWTRERIQSCFRNDRDHLIGGWKVKQWKQS